MAKSRSPSERLGVFKQLSDVPDSRRFYQYESAYRGEDTWADYRSTVELSNRMGEDWALFARRWKNHTEQQGRHHALCQPVDVETWSEWMLSQFSRDRAYQHWNVIEGFYNWLKWHIDHPHTYNPFHMAASEQDSNARQIWARKMEKR